MKISSKLFPQPDTLIEDAERIKQTGEEKEDYSDLYRKICDKDLIPAYNKCQTELIRRETKVRNKNTPVDDFEKIKIILIDMLLI